MAYSTGTSFNFENRLHALAKTTGDLSLFLSEAETYTVDYTVLNKWNREFEHKTYEFTGEWTDIDIGTDGGGEEAISMTNAAKLALPANTPVGTRVRITDAIGVSGGTQDGVYTERGIYESKPFYNLIGQPDEIDEGMYAILWDTVKWNINNADGDLTYYSLSAVATPDLASNWKNASDDTPASIVVEIPVQELQAPSVAQGGVFVSGGTQDGIYYKTVNQFEGKDGFVLTGIVSDGPFDNGFGIGWVAASINSYFGVGPSSPGFFIMDVGQLLYYSLSDVATPDLAGTDKVMMFEGISIGGVFTKRGTSNGKSYYTLLGESDSTTVFAIVWVGGMWKVFNGSGVVVNFSSDDVATPDLATWDDNGLGAVINIAWLNASDDTPASITVTSVTQGELDAGVTVSGAGSSASNGAFFIDGNANTKPKYSSVSNPALDSIFYDGDGWIIHTDAIGNDYRAQPATLPFPFGETFTVANGDSPAPTVTRNNVASEANWVLVE